MMFGSALVVLFVPLMVLFLIFLLIRVGRYRKMRISLLLLGVALFISGYFSIAGALHAKVLAPKLAMMGVQNGKLTVRKGCHTFSDIPTLLDEPDVKKFPTLNQADEQQVARIFTLNYLQYLADFDATIEKLKPLRRLEDVSKMMQVGDALTVEGRLRIKSGLNDYCQFLRVYYDATFTKFIGQYNNSYHKPESDSDKMVRMTKMHGFFNNYLNAVRNYVVQEARAVDLSMSYVNFLTIVAKAYRVKNGKIFFGSKVLSDYHNLYIAAMQATGQEEKAKMIALRDANTALRSVEY